MIIFYSSSLFCFISIFIVFWRKIMTWCRLQILSIWFHEKIKWLLIGYENSVKSTLLLISCSKVILLTKYFVKTAYGVQHTYFSMTNDFLLSPISPNISWNHGFEETLLEYLELMQWKLGTLFLDLMY